MDMSNKNLALILVAAIVISLGGTIVSLNRLGQMSAEYSTVTGYATSTGTVNVTITSTSVVNVTDTTIKFGEGAFEEANRHCTLFSNGTDSMSPSGCGNWTWTADYIEFKNVGSTVIDVNVTSNRTGAQLLGAAENLFQFYCLASSGTSTSEIATWTSFSAAEQDCITSLDQAGSDRLFAKVNVSENSTAGSDRRALLTFTAYQGT